MEKTPKSSNFFKSFGMGLIYTIVFPLIVLVSFAYALIAIGEFVFESFPGIVRFFKGEEFFPKLREDKEVALVLKAQHERMLNGIAPKEKQPAAPQAPTNVYVQNNYYQAPAGSIQNSPNEPFQNGIPYIDGSSPFVNPAISQQNPANPAQISQTPLQITSTNPQKEPVLAEIPTYAPVDKAIDIGPLGGNDDSHD